MNLDPRLLDVFQSVFGDDVALTSPHDGPDTIAEWDSVNHLNLILAIESEFGIQFPTERISRLTSVGAIQEQLADV